MYTRKNGLIHTNYKGFTWLFYCVLYILIAISIAACSNDSSSGSISSNDGSVAFNLQDLRSEEMAATASPNAFNEVIPSNSADSNFEVMVYFGETLLASDGSVSYDTQPVTITGVPAGANRTVVVMSCDSRGNILSFGEQTGVTILAGYTTDIEGIELHDFIPQIKSINSGDGEITISWGSVDDAQSYTVYRATYPGVNSTHYEDRVSNIKDSSYTQTELENGTLYYYVVTAVNAYGVSAESDEALAAPGYDTVASDSIAFPCLGGDSCADNYAEGKLVLPNEIDSGFSKAEIRLNVSDSKTPLDYYFGSAPDLSDPIFSGSNQDSVIIDVKNDIQSLDPSNLYYFGVQNDADAEVSVNNIRLIVYYDQQQ